MTLDDLKRQAMNDFRDQGISIGILTVIDYLKERGFLCNVK